MSLSLQNLPSPKEESWKYTNLERALPKGLTHGPEEDEILIHRNRGQNGEEDVELLFTGCEGQYQNPQLKLVLEEGAQMILIEHHDGKGAYWKNMNVQIDLAAGAQLTHYRMLKDSEFGISTLTTQIRQSSSSIYKAFYIIDPEEESSVSEKREETILEERKNVPRTNRTKACESKEDEDGNNAIEVNKNSKAKPKPGLIRNEITAILNGQGAQCHISGLNFLEGYQHGDTTLLIEHKAPHCDSSQFFRSILTDRARGVYQGKVLVHEGAQKTSASQLSNAILLSDKSEMDAKPELEIYNDDVMCSHGATTGQISEETLFYMRSRGLNEAQARALLIEAFVGELVDKLEDKMFRTSVEERVSIWLCKVL